MKKIYLLLVTICFSLSCYCQDTLKHITSEVTVNSNRFENSSSSFSLIQPRNSFNFSSETPFFLSSFTSMNYQTDNGSPFGYSYLSLRGMNQNRSY